MVIYKLSDSSCSRAAFSNMTLPLCTCTFSSPSPSSPSPSPSSPSPSPSSPSPCLCPCGHHIFTLHYVWAKPSFSLSAPLTWITPSHCEDMFNYNISGTITIIQSTPWGSRVSPCDENVLARYCMTSPSPHPHPHPHPPSPSPSPSQDHRRGMRKGHSPIFLFSSYPIRDGMRSEVP